MKKHLFLTGPADCGKSELLRDALGGALANAGGFVTARERQNGRIVRCSLLPAAAAAGVEGFAPLPFLDLSLNPPLHDNEVFRGDGTRLLQEAAWYPFAVLDAFGSFELLIPQYRQALTELLNAEQPVVGVLLGRKEAAELCRLLGLGERVGMNIEQLWKALKADPDTMILEAAGLGRRRAERALAEWVREYAV